MNRINQRLEQSCGGIKEEAVCSSLVVSGLENALPVADAECLYYLDVRHEFLQFLAYSGSFFAVELYEGELVVVGE